MRGASSMLTLLMVLMLFGVVYVIQRIPMEETVEETVNRIIVVLASVLLVLYALQALCVRALPLRLG